jgi:hypothetical protein
MFSSHYCFNWEPAVLVTADRDADQQITARNVLSRIHRAYFSQAYIPRPTALFLLFYFFKNLLHNYTFATHELKVLCSCNIFNYSQTSYIVKVCLWFFSEQYFIYLDPLTHKESSNWNTQKISAQLLCYFASYQKFSLIKVTYFQRSGTSHHVCTQGWTLPVSARVHHFTAHHRLQM